jgi:hypothetical protein
VYNEATEDFLSSRLVDSRNARFNREMVVGEIGEAEHGGEECPYVRTWRLRALPLQYDPDFDLIPWVQQERVDSHIVRVDFGQ